MSFELIQRKKEALSELMDALFTIKKVFPALSEEERKDVFDGLCALFGAPPPAASEPQAPGSEGRATTAAGAVTIVRFPPPARAVELLLEKSPVPLFANDIVSALEGKIQTSSQKPRDVIYSAIAFLKSKGTINQLPDKSYIFLRQSPDQDGSEGGDAFRDL